MIKRYFIPFLALALVACEDETPTPVEDNTTPIPTSYSFERDGFSTVSYSGQTQRLDMLGELSSYAKSAVDGTPLLEQRMNDMFNNENQPFADSVLNASTKSLGSKCFSLDKETMKTYFHYQAMASQAGNTAAENGVAGVLESADGSKRYLVDANGMEWAQRIEKEIMGAVFYYQATSVYLGEEKIGEFVDNTTPVDPENGKYYTTMEHHWDEAFGYFGVDPNFPSVTSTARFFGKYCNSRNDLLNTNEEIMHGFISGRNAITNNDANEKNIAISEVRAAWRKVVASTAIHYLNGSVEDFSDDALRCHQLSEAIAFIRSLKYNEEAGVSTETIEAWTNRIGDNLYEVTIADLNFVRDQISDTYGFNDVKSTL